MKVLISVLFCAAALSLVNAGATDRQCSAQNQALSLRYNYYLADYTLVNNRKNEVYSFELTPDTGNAYKIAFNLCYNMPLEQIQEQPGLVVRGKIDQFNQLVGYIKDQDPSYEFQINGIKLIYDIVPVNNGVFNKLEVDLQCDLLSDNYLNDLSPVQRKSSIDDKKITLAFKTKAGCATFEENAFSKALQQSKWLFFVVYLVLGIYYCFFGLKFVKITAFVSGFIFVSIFVFRISVLIVGGSASTLTIWLLVLLSLALGALGGFIGTKLIPLAVFILGLITGLVVASILGQLFAIIFVSGVANILLLIAIVIGLIAGGYAGCKYRKEIIIIGTGINGAYLIILALGAVIGGLPTVEEMAARAQGHQGTSTGQLLGYFFGNIVLAIAGIVFQCKYHKTEGDIFGAQPDSYSQI